MKKIELHDISAKLNMQQIKETIATLFEIKSLTNLLVAETDSQTH